MTSFNTSLGQCHSPRMVKSRQIQNSMPQEYLKKTPSGGQMTAILESECQQSTSTSFLANLAWTSSTTTSGKVFLHQRLLLFTRKSKGCTCIELGNDKTLLASNQKPRITPSESHTDALNGAAKILEMFRLGVLCCR